MVARKGPINDWHFSHEGGQERPECPAGALNLLRRLAIQELERAPSRIQDYLMAHPQPGCAPLRWTDRPVQPIRLVAGADSRSTEVARVALERSGEARIFVTIGRESPPLITSGAVLWVSVPLPEQVVIRSQADARAFVQAEMAVRWLHLPDIDGLLAAARVQAAQAMRERQEAAQRAQLLRRAEAGQRWEEIRRASAMADPPAAPTVDEPPPPAAPRHEVRPVVEWAPGLAGRGSLQLRKMHDGTQWVYYPAGKYWRIAPAPELFEGWDEYFPPGVAVVDGERSLRVVDDGRILTWFHGHCVASVIDSDPVALSKHFATT
jgi:hypothetical protein